MDNTEQDEIIYYEHPDFKFFDDEEREQIESIENDNGWRPISKQEIREFFLKDGFAPPPLDNIVEKSSSDAAD